MNRFKFTWYNLVGTLNSLILPKDQTATPIEDGDDVATALAKLQAQVTAIQEAL